jgi:CheY-like chemotaxis protein
MTDKAAMSILLVDDDDVAAEAVVRGLRKHSAEFPIVIAEDGAAALAILRGEHSEHVAAPYIVLLDLNMPGMSGLEFLQTIRVDPALRSTIVFVLTTSGAEADRRRAYELSIAGYMTKAGVGPQFAGLARFLTAYDSVVLFAQEK